MTLLQNHTPAAGEDPEGIFRNPLIELAIKESFFKNKKDIGVKYANYFNPMPLETIALIVTMVSVPVRVCSALVFLLTGAIL